MFSKLVLIVYLDFHLFLERNDMDGVHSPAVTLVDGEYAYRLVVTTRHELLTRRCVVYVQHWVKQTRLLSI